MAYGYRPVAAAFGQLPLAHFASPLPCTHLLLGNSGRCPLRRSFGIRMEVVQIFVCLSLSYLSPLVCELPAPEHKNKWKGDTDMLNEHLAVHLSLVTCLFGADIARLIGKEAWSRTDWQGAPYCPELRPFLPCLAENMVTHILSFEINPIRHSLKKIPKSHAAFHLD